MVAWFEEGHRCGRRRTADVTTAAPFDTRALTNDEWAYVDPLIPPARRGGNKRHVGVREVMNAVMYVLSMGCQWRAIP